jgi:hypothetical protein
MGEFSTSNQLYLCLILGLLSICFGLYGVFARRQRVDRPSWRGPLVLATLLLSLGVTTAVAGLPTFVSVPATILGMVWLLLALCPTVLISKAVRSTRLHGALLLIAGFTLLGWQAHAIDRSLNADLEESDKHLAALGAVPPLEELTDRKAWTDVGTFIPLLSVVPGTPEESPAVETGFLSRHGYEMKLIQTSKIDPTYNCHGWVFTGGKAWIRGAFVEQILRENRYTAVSKPTGNDIAVYRDSRGEVMHTALVQGVAEDGTILMESKWGKLGRYVHTSTIHVYAGHSCTFYRSPRAGHLLRINGDVSP